MWPHALIATGILGLIALALVIWSRLYRPNQMKSYSSHPLVFLSPTTKLDTPPSLPEPRWRQHLPGRQHKLVRDANFLYHLIQIVNNAPTPDQILTQVLEKLSAHLELNVGRIFLLDDEETLQLAASLDSSTAQTPLPNWEFTLPNLVLSTGKPLIVSDLDKWPQLRSFIPALDLASSLWLPIKAGEQVIGVLGLGSSRRNAFYQDSITMISAAASYLGTAVENQLLKEKILEEKRLRQDLERYVSPRLLKTFQQHIPKSHTVVGGSDRISVLFADVRDYTPLMEQTDAGSVMQVLNQYFLRMSQIIQSHGGIVDEFVGDEIVASFDRTSPRVNDAYRAVKTGLEMLASLNTLRKKWLRRGLPIFDIGIGISSGTVTRGSIGSQERKALIALGSILNIASRVEGMNKEFGTHLIITQSTFEQIANYIEYDLLGSHKLQGISQPMALYSVRSIKNHFRSNLKVSNDSNGIAQATQHRQSFAERINPGISSDILA